MQREKKFNWILEEKDLGVKTRKEKENRANT